MTKPTHDSVIELLNTFALTNDELEQLLYLLRQVANGAESEEIRRLAGQLFAKMTKEKYK